MRRNVSTTKAIKPIKSNIKVMPSMDNMNDFAVEDHPPNTYHHVLSRYYDMPMCDCGKHMQAAAIEFEDGNVFNLENILNMCTLTYVKDTRQKILCIQNEDKRLLMIDKDGDMTLLGKNKGRTV